jgi:hypothetical protein
MAALHGMVNNFPLELSQQFSWGAFLPYICLIKYFCQISSNLDNLKKSEN